MSYSQRDSTFSIDLPTDLVIEIANQLQNLSSYKCAESDSDLEALGLRQRALWSFCLVSQQWFSVGVHKLYREPFLSTRESFTKLIRTICPSAEEEDRNGAQRDPAFLIRGLRMRELRHKASDVEIIARLLSKVGSQLTYLEGSKGPWSSDCLKSLSMCQKLIDLDLSQVTHQDCSQSLTSLRSPIRKLRMLTTLKLPVHMYLTRRPGVAKWSELLNDLTIGGNLDEYAMRLFVWPSSLKYLTMLADSRISNFLLIEMFSNVQLQNRLERLTIHPECTFIPFLLSNHDSDLLHRFASLRSIQIPADLAWFFRLLGSDLLPKEGLTDITFGPTTTGAYGDHRFENRLIESLSFGPLSKIWSLRLTRKLFETFVTTEKEIDATIKCHLDTEMEGWWSFGSYKEVGFQVFPPV